MAPTYEEMDAIALLKADHRRVEELFAAFEAATGSARRQKLALQACLELKVHTVIEEEIFYPACEGRVEDDLMKESFVEHDSAKLLINEIEAAGPDDDFYDAKVKVLSEEIEHHVAEEEKRSEGMFAQARAAGLDMDELADRMRARRKSATDEFQSGKPAETRTMAGDKGGETGRTEAADAR